MSVVCLSLARCVSRLISFRRFVVSMKYVCGREFMKSVVILSLFAVSVLMLTGCRGIPAPGEKQARHDLVTVADKFRPANQPPVLPELTPDSSLSNFVTYALLNHC